MASMASVSAQQANQLAYHAESNSHAQILSVKIDAAIGPSGDKEDDSIIEISSDKEEED